jgi:hypothetical protein
MGESNRYVSEAASIRYDNAWCPDGARKEIPPPTARNQFVGCHFIYEAFAEGDGDTARFVLRARGATTASRGMEFWTLSFSSSRGVVMRSLQGPNGPPVAASELSARALEHEALAGLKGIFVAEKSFYAEKDRWGTRFDEMGWVPDPVCPDAARAQIQVREEPSVAVGCHFSYSVELHKELGFVATARGEIGRTRGRAFRVVGLGASAGTVEELLPKR